MTLRQFFGLSLAFGFVRIDDLFFNILSPRAGHLIDHKIANEPEVVYVPDELHALASRVASASVSDAPAPAMIDEWVSTISYIFRKAKNNPRVKTGGERGRQDGEELNRVLLAAELYFDSYLAPNDVMAYLHTMIALEVLLGNRNESSSLSIQQLLGNRCAYLVASSYSERNEILKTFKDIYEIRSKIVHGGHRKLVGDQSIMLHRLRDLCRRAIAEEVRLAVEDGEA